MALDLHQLATRVGRYHRIEIELFERLGRLATNGPAANRARLGAFAHQHAWHGALWADRFPIVPGRDLADVAMPDNIATALQHTADDAPPAALFRVVIPRLLAAYDEHAAEVDPDTDGPTARALLLCRRDLLDEWVAGERLVTAMLTSTEAIDAAADEVRRAERSLLEHGGLLGRD